MGFQVCKERCDQCLFTPQRIVSVQRMKGILAECRRNDSHFSCHKFPLGDVCCRGFYDANPAATNLMRIAMRLHAIEEIAVPALKIRDLLAEE